jgi:transposase
MPAARLCVRQIKLVFRLFLLESKSPRAIAAATGAGRTTVRDYLARLEKSGLKNWLEIEPLSEPELERRLGFAQPALCQQKSMPDWAGVHRELAKKHVTIALLWTEYREAQGESAYGYTQFCEHYRRWSGKLSVVMRQSHRAGEKTFIDYSGDGLSFVDPATGERKKVELFVAALGASSYTYAEATLTQTLPDWVGSHARMSAFFGAASEIWVPDNLKSGVTKADRYEALLNETYRDCASHYGACVIPARALKPRDKAKVEAAVLVAQRWILARLRNRLFCSLAEINEAIAECLETINSRKMRHVNKSRLELFEELDRPAMRPLPATSFEFAEWKKATVNIDYHIVFDHHRYSVPYQLVQTSVDVRATATVVEIFCRGKRVGSHRRSSKRGGYTTAEDHMPKSHREHASWTPERVVGWSREIGASTALLVEKILSTKKHPQQGFMAALGIVRLAGKYGNERVERASGRALETGAHSYHFLKSMLKNKMDGGPSRGMDYGPMEPQVDEETKKVQLPLLGAENVRGGDYYH